MKMLILINEDIHSAALTAARQIDRAPTLPGDVLHAPLDDESSGWIDRIWD